jgi:ubiquitin-protein ligase
MRVYIWDFTHDRYYPALVSERATVGKLLSQITPQIIKERGPGRQLVAYLQRTGEQLFRNPQGRYIRRGGVSSYRTLHPWQTLSSVGVVENEILVLCYFIQPGAKATDLRKRLAQERRSLKELAAKSDLIKVEPKEGKPPTKYLVTFKCRGMMLRPNNGKPCLTANHVMEIYLPAGIPGYPNEAPYVICLTPHFHPNISQENNMVCIGIERDWESSLDIAWLVTHLADMITYRVYGFEKPYNKEAVKWAKANKAKLPVDNRPLFKEKVAAAVTTKEDDGEVSFDKPVAVARGTAKSPPLPKTKRPIKAKAAVAVQSKSASTARASSKPTKTTAKTKSATKTTKRKR